MSRGASGAEGGITTSHIYPPIDITNKNLNLNSQGNLPGPEGILKMVNTVASANISKDDLRSPYTPGGESLSARQDLSNR